MHTFVLQAQQQLEVTIPKIKDAQAKYKVERNEQRERLAKEKCDVDDETFWKSTSEHAPETRMEISRRTRLNRGKDKETETKIQKSITLFTKNGRPLNVNQCKLNFTFVDENPEAYVLELHVYKYLY